MSSEMNVGDPLVPCAACGRMNPPNDMFGLPPDLLCPACAKSRRERMLTKVRPAPPKSRGPIVTVVCLGIMGALFLATDVFYRTPVYSEMPRWLELLFQREGIWRGEFWRHVGAVFLHGGPVHILMNGLALWSIGRIIEIFWSHGTLALLILTTGVSSAAAQWIVSGPGVGISGAIFGLCGYLWALHTKHPIARAVMTKQMRNWIIMMSILMVVLTMSGSMRIGNTAHGTGFVLGYLLGWMEGRNVSKRLRIATMLGIMVATVIAAQFVALGSEKRGNREYPRKLLRASYLESEQ